MTMRWLATPSRTRWGACGRRTAREGLRERVDVDDLAVADDARGERRNRGALDGDAAARSPRLRSRARCRADDCLPCRSSHERQDSDRPNAR